MFTSVSSLNHACCRVCVSDCVCLIVKPICRRLCVLCERVSQSAPTSAASALQGAVCVSCYRYHAVSYQQQQRLKVWRSKPAFLQRSGASVEAQLNSVRPPRWRGELYVTLMVLFSLKDDSFLSGRWTSQTDNNQEVKGQQKKTADWAWMWSRAET